MLIADITKSVRLGKFEISLHAEKERYAEEISIEDLINAISAGMIIEDYPSDPRGPSCLILGYSKDRPIHIVCGYSTKQWIRIITVYLPKPPKWKNETTRG